MTTWLVDHDEDPTLVIADWRDIIRNNGPGVWWKPDGTGRRKLVRKENFLVCAHFVAKTDETWLPNVLVQLGLFPSNNRVKSNRPEFWRNLENGEIVKFSWAKIQIFLDNQPHS